MALLACLLTLAAFRLANIQVPWLAVCAVFFIAISSMLQNDWRDKYHDRLKKKYLATQHPQKFILVLVAFWVISSIFIVFSLIQNLYLGMALSMIALIGLSYSETRKVPFIPGILVSLTSSSIALLPLALGHAANKILLLFVSVFFIVFAREIMKDMDDQAIDKGYKWTIPVVLGNNWTKISIGTAIVIGALFSIKISALLIPEIIIQFFGFFLFVQNPKNRNSKIFIDVGMLMGIFTLLFFI